MSVFHIQTGADADCNTNSVPDSCESVGDCDGDGVGDGCELDCNRNEVPDDCELAGGAADCNDNGTPDDCDVATGRSRDCDADGVPDECTSEHEFSARSPLMTPIYYALPQEWIVRTPPTPASDVVIDVTLQVGLTATEYVDVLLNGTLLSHFATSTDGARPQPPRGRPPHLIHIGLTAAEFQTLLVGGDAVFSITTNWDAGCYGPSPRRDPRFPMPGSTCVTPWRAGWIATGPVSPIRVTSRTARRWILTGAAYSMSAKGSATPISTASEDRWMRACWRRACLARVGRLLKVWGFRLQSRRRRGPWGFARVLAHLWAVDPLPLCRGLAESEARLGSVSPRGWATGLALATVALRQKLGVPIITGSEGRGFQCLCEGCSCWRRRLQRDRDRSATALAGTEEERRAEDSGIAILC